MQPLVVTCELMGSVLRPPQLDALLQALVALRDGLPQLDRMHPESWQKIDIPIEVEPGGRFHLCSGPRFVEVGNEIHYKNRRFPVEIGAKLGDPKTVKSIQISAGAEKSYRIPHSVAFLEGNKITWFCVGDREQLLGLLRFCKYVGKFRNVGKGKVRQWTVEPMEAWEGFPVVYEGKPLRSLPANYPGLVEPELGYSVVGSVVGPYWDTTRKELCAVP